jgi:hypothetical protein
MSTSNLNSPKSSSADLPTVVESTLSAVLDDSTTPVVVPKAAALVWQKAGRRSDGKQAALTAEQRATNAKIAADKAAGSGRKPPSGKSASSGSGRKPQGTKSVRYCRFEDHHYDREEKTWIPSADGALRMCPDKDCTFSHRVARPGPCPIGDECSDHECKLLHSKQRPKPCRFGENCINEKCGFFHPSTRRQPCPNGANCYEHACEKQRCDEDEPGPGCPYGHPSRMMRICQHNHSCKRFECNFLHHADAPRDCPDSGQCQLQWQRNGVIPQEEVCQNKHPRYTRVMEDSNCGFRFM